jgi:cytochrome c-type biogenesis protein CcmH
MRARSTHAATLTILGLLAISLLLPASVLASASHPSLPEIEPQVMCVTCKIPLNTAESPQASAERDFIREQIAAGDGEAEVRNALVAQYGPAVLALPSTKGFDLAAYLVPLVVVLALIAILALLLPRWRRAARRDRFVAAGSPLSKTDAERLRDDMKRFE